MIFTSLTLETSDSTTRFYCNEGFGNSDLWLKALRRIVIDNTIEDKNLCCKVDLGDFQDSVGNKKMRRLKDAVRDPLFYVELERVLHIIEVGDWNGDYWLNIDRKAFVRAVKTIWHYAKDKLPFEQQLLEVLLEDGNGGLRVETVMDRLYKKGLLCGFGRVRQGLYHLCKLCLVENAHGMFSVNYGLLDL